jgi:hypothetical protein
MKFQASVVFDIEASSIADAGEKLNELVQQAEDVEGMKVASVHVGTRPHADPVTLPSPLPVPQVTPARPPGPPHYSPPVTPTLAQSG